MVLPQGHDGVEQLVVGGHQVATRPGALAGGDDRHGLGVDLERPTRVVTDEQPVVDGLHVGVGEVGQSER